MIRSVPFRQTPLKLTRRGYVRNLGNPQQKFYLGFDSPVAAQRREWIQSIWVENCLYLRVNHWNDAYLDVARQIGKHGYAVVKYEEDVDGVLGGFGPPDATWVHHLRDQGVPIRMFGKHVARVTLPELVTPENKPATIKLHAAIEAYKKDRLDGYSGTFQGKKRTEGQIQKFFEIEDCWLHEMNFLKVKNYVDHLKGRPETARGNRCSKTWAENQICEFYAMLKWFGSCYSTEFVLPNLETINRKVARLVTDATGNSIRSNFFSRDELRKVYGKATQPLTKLIIALGLNTCSGAAELGRMRITDFHFNREHPKAKIIEFGGKHNWLITTRRKSWAHSEAFLWSWVAKLVKAQIDICEKNGWLFLFTDDDGKPLYKCNEVYEEADLDPPNKKKPEAAFVSKFRKPCESAGVNRSLGKLRKTYSNWLRDKKEGELASLALAHQNDDDLLLKHYANQPYARLFKVTKEAGEYWKLA